MNSLIHLLVVDLASYGAAFAIVNQFCDDSQVKVFEISPAGSAGLLILSVEEAVAAEILKNEILSFFKGSVLSLRLVKEARSELLEVYLSRNKNPVTKSLLTLEFSFVSEAFDAAQTLLKQNIQIVDFRVIRTFPANVFIVATAEDSAALLSAKNQVHAKTAFFIEKAESVLKSYFEI